MSRLLALVMALVLALGTFTTAMAEDATGYAMRDLTKGVLEDLTASAGRYYASQFYGELMATTTEAEFNEIKSSHPIFGDWLFSYMTDEEMDNLFAHNVELSAVNGEALTATAADGGVVVDAPAGAFPTGTAANVAAVKDEAILAALAEAIAAVDETAQIVSAYDINFNYSALGQTNEVQPKTAVPLTFEVATDDLNEEYNSLSVYHMSVSEDGNFVADHMSDSSIIKSANKQTVTIESNAFSIYILAGTISGSSSDNQYYILRGTSIEFTVNTNATYTVTYPEGFSSAEAASVSVSKNNRTLTFAALDNAAMGTYTLRIQSGNSTRNVTIQVMTPEEIFGVVEEDSVYFTCVRDSTNIPSEPMSGGNYNWTYITGVNNGTYSFTNGWGGAFKSSPTGFLDLEEIGSSPALKQNLQGQNVIGVIDTGDGVNTLPCIEMTDEEWHAVLKQFVSYTTVEISNGQGGTTTLTSSMVDEKLEDGSYRYRMYPYVIKLILESSEYQKGWHVDCAIVDMKTYWVAYEYNLPNTAVIQESSDLIRPDRAFYTPGTTGVDVGSLKLGNSNVTSNTSITIYNTNTLSTSEYKFLYWNTQPDGSGTTYNPGDELPAINSNVTLYAIWNYTQTSGTVKISKAVVFEDPNDERKDEAQSYTFTVTFANAAEGTAYPYTIFNANGTEKTTDVTIASGGNIVLMNGEYAIIYNAPGGAVTVAETVAVDAGYEASWKIGTSETATTGNSVVATVVAGSQTTVACTNTYAPLTADLIITKTVTDADTTDAITPDSNQEFQFEVTLDDVAYSENPVKVKSGVPVTIPAIRIGTEYTIKEINIPVGYENTTANLNENDELAGTIVGGENANTVTFTNTFKVADLTITKAITNKDDNTKDDVFTFDVTYGGKTETKTITGEGSVTIEDIPINTAYTVTEKNLPTGYTMSGATVNGNTATVENNSFTSTIGEANAVVVTNDYTTKSLTITKKIVDTNGDDVTDTNTADDVFTFDVTLPAGTYGVTGIAGVQNMTFGATAQTITISGQNSVTFSGIPAGAAYTVVESETLPTGYDYKTSSNANGKLDDDTEAVVTNLYKTATLTISKTVEAKNIDTAKEFTFTVTLPDGTYSYTVGQETKTLTVANGTGTLTLKHDEIAVIAGVPVDATYTVAETADANYTTTVTGEESGTMTENGARVAYTNIYKTGSLTISKGGIADVDNHDASGDSKEEKQSTIYRVQGVANTATAGIDVTVVIYGNSSTTITNLPLGNYTVTELTDWAWRYSPVGGAVKEAAVDADGASVSYSNTRTNLYWLNGDNYSENTFAEVE